MVFIIVTLWTLVIVYVNPSIVRFSYDSLKSQVQIIKQDTDDDLCKSVQKMESLAQNSSIQNYLTDTSYQDELELIFQYSGFDQLTILDTKFVNVFQYPNLALIQEHGNDKSLRSLMTEGVTTLIGLENGPERMYISIASPIFNNENQIIGIIKGSFNIRENFFNPTILNTRIGDSGRVFVFDNQGMILSHGNEAWIGQNIYRATPEEVKLEMQSSIVSGEVFITQFKNTETEEEIVLGATSIAGNLNIGIYYDQDELFAPISNLTNVIIFITTLTCLLVTFIGILHHRRLSRPYTLLIKHAEKIAKGKLNTPFPKISDAETIQFINAMKRVFAERDKLFLQTIHALTISLEKRDNYTAGHSERVTKYAIEIAKIMGITDEQLDDLYLGGILHDIGKIGIPDKVLFKKGKLTEVEFNEIKKHPIYGDEIIQHINSLEHIRPIIRSHHERFDGTGYPDRLKGENIDILARVTCVADAFDAMTSDRPYRKGMAIQDAINIITSESGKQFDPNVVEAFLKWQQSLGYHTA